MCSIVRFSQIVNTIELILKEINAEGKTVIVVTHDEKVASVAKKRIYIEDGICRVQ